MLSLHSFHCLDIQSLVLASFPILQQESGLITCLIQLHLTASCFLISSTDIGDTSLSVFRAFSSCPFDSTVLSNIHSIFSWYHHSPSAYCICCHSNICCLLCIVDASSWYAPTCILWGCINVNFVTPFWFAIRGIRSFVLGENESAICHRF